MSLVPLLFSKFWEDLDDDHHLPGQNFGHALLPDDLEMPVHPYHDLVARPHILHRRFAHRRHPYDRSLALTQRPGGLSTVHKSGDSFNVSLETQHFQPEELTVKVVGNSVLISGNHDEKRDEHGYISRSFTRKYLIPESCDIDKLTSSLSSDGVLSISVPRKELPLEDKKERIIEIQHTGAPAIKDADSQKEVAKVAKRNDSAQPRPAEKIVKAA